LIAIPLAVSIVAILLTPALRSATSRAVTATAKALKLLGTRGVRLRMRQLNDELKQLDRFTEDPRAIAFYVG
jgi:hypothetical protein